MNAVSPENFDKAYLRAQVAAEYDRVARKPQGEYHFHRGPQYAVQFLGYDAVELDSLPLVATTRFAGVGNPLSIGPINRGETVLDHACGAGTDLLLAAMRVGPSGKAIGVDMTPAMRNCALSAAELVNLSNIVDIRGGFFEELPVDDNSVDVVISNGVLNLSPEKEKVLSEINRVLKPGGRLHLADVIVQRELTADARSNPDLWAACIGGALVEPQLAELASQSGLINAHIVRRFNCFYNTTAESKVAKDLFVHSVNFFASKPN